ncbi:NUDIX domain-containing protein [Arenibacter aquaticus]|uniref:NUDIX domain-containing protein n=1 Tax=Arenibacter aquaticus TaxID=2489054 RepID=A0A430K244_9FLAO|nr:NUDIX domain-containing protein [Arenibacter aquaticus]RTE53160.1 NUDIX domain-containing protein [Arenibacter aquaticus]
MDELIDVLDAQGNYTGESIMKSEAHRKGIYHPSIHVWLYTNNGEILIQQRAKGKDTHPGLWDVSVAGHIGAGEDITSSAIREVEEEIGLTVLPQDLHKIGVFEYSYQHNEELLDREFHHTFLSQLNVAVSELVMQEVEVDDLALISIATFKDELKNNAQTKKYVPYDPEYYNTVLQAIEKQL